MTAARFFLARFVCRLGFTRLAYRLVPARRFRVVAR